MHLAKPGPLAKNSENSVPYAMLMKPLWPLCPYVLRIALVALVTIAILQSEPEESPMMMPVPPSDGAGSIEMVNDGLTLPHR